VRDAERRIDFAAMQEKLYSAVIADILDDLGFRWQALSHDVRPVDPSYTLVGRAYTILATDVYEMPEEPYLKELEAVDSLSAGDVVVATTNGSTSCGLWGELLSTAAASKGARGAVIDGLTRDSAAIMRMGFPVFARGYSPLDSKGRAEVIAHGGRIRCGDAVVATGDIVFGDHDGVVVIPAEVADQVLPRALEKASGEDSMKRALQNGMGIMEAYEKYGIL
jgi:4-hydroxy-4-methyl-2-oxoglutarate aldolase